MVHGVFTIPLPRQSASSTPARKRAAAAGSTEFVGGPENRLAQFAVMSAIADGPWDFNPLVLYGPSGSGKSHLARGIAAWWQQHDPASSVLSLSASEFAHQYAEAIEKGRLDAWRATCREARLLVLEDLGQLSGKNPAQRELWHTLDAILRENALVIVTSRVLPAQLPALLPALRSRLEAGLTVPLALPGHAARRVIIERLAAHRQIGLSKPAIETLSDGLKLSAAGLLGALLELQISAPAAAIDAEQARRYVAAHSHKEPLALRTIAIVTAKYFDLKLSELKSPSRRQAIVAARGVAIYLARQLTDQSLDAIGKFFGRRDHTTILSSYRRTSELVAGDPAIRQAEQEIRRMLVSA